MKTSIKNLFRLLVPVAMVGLMPVSQMKAQTFTTLYSFTPNGVNQDGAYPEGGLLLEGNTLYGTTATGGSSIAGTVFAVNTDGSGFSNLHNFDKINGGMPAAELVISGNTLYGTDQGTGADVPGTVFAININGSGFTNLYCFNFPLGGQPRGKLVLSGSVLYGTSEDGGDYGWGSVFSVNTNGMCFTNVYSFSGGNDGRAPIAGLVLSASTLYGTTEYGGNTGNGTVFGVNTDGTGFTNIYNFTSIGDYPYTNSDGAYPTAGLVLSGNALFGTTSVGGGLANAGTVFRVNTDGTCFTNLHSFTADAGESGFLNSGTNSDGSTPYAALILSGNTLYGTASEGGGSGNGTIFQIDTDGTGFKTLHNFGNTQYGVNSDGAGPYAGLILSGNSLYGTAESGGSGGDGTVFSLSLPLPPQLGIVLSGTNVILTWPTNATGFTLQSTASLVPAAWRTNLPVPIIVNGRYTVTNLISGTQQYYQLSR